MTEPVSKGEKRMEQALARFNTVRHQLGDSPNERTLLAYQSALAELTTAVAHEVEHDMADARERMEAREPSDLEVLLRASLIKAREARSDAAPVEPEGLKLVKS